MGLQTIPLRGEAKHPCGPPVPVPGDETLYYIFTTKDVYGDGTFELRYALFDLKLNNGTGGIVDPDGNPATPPSTLLFAKSTERITGNANWLIAHEYGNNSFRAYKITQQGIGNPVISSIGSDHNFATAANGQGYMKLGAKKSTGGSAFHAGRIQCRRSVRLCRFLGDGEQLQKRRSQKWQRTSLWRRAFGGWK